MESQLSPDERSELLKLARKWIEIATAQQPLPILDIGSYPEALRKNGASFVTLTINKNLRGCIGALEAYQPLVQDVCEHAVAAALEDYRFPVVQPNEVPRLHIEISRLTPPVSLEYESPADLPGLLRPGVDGVILRDGMKRATFLPQVWDQLPDPTDFLSHLCHKMGAHTNLWQQKILGVQIYQVEEFEEENPG